MRGYAHSATPGMSRIASWELQKMKTASALQSAEGRWLFPQALRLGGRRRPSRCGDGARDFTVSVGESGRAVATVAQPVVNKPAV